MSCRLIESTVGRRLVTRIWVHGVLLFVGVVGIVLLARWVMRDHEAAAVMRARPAMAARLVQTALARHADGVALRRELAFLDAETPLEVAVFSPTGEPIAGSGPRPTAVELHDLAPARDPEWGDDRLVVGHFVDGVLVSVATLEVPSMPSAPLHILGLLLTALLLGFVFVAAPLAYAIARPIERLRELARELGTGNLAVRANSDRHDEIGDLARSFDTMAGHIQKLRAAERQLLGDVSHELRTPLARMRVVLDLASDADIERVRRYLGEITTDLAELEQLVDDIIVSSRFDPETNRWDEAKPPLRMARTSIDDVLDASVARFKSRWPDRIIAERREGALDIEADVVMLRRVLDNLLDNARKYSPEDAPIELASSVERVGDRDRVRIEVIDRGQGIPDEDQARVFSPFYRADRSRTRTSGGVGLGLTLARRIVDAHGGVIGFESVVDRGSRFWFALDAR